MDAQLFRDIVSQIKREVSKSLVGQKDVLDHLLLTLIARGHALIEGVPGLGKTLLVKTLSQVVGLDFSRIQFTPDLMPADITGTMILEEEEGRRYFRFQKGPLFANLILADEINRATPKTQSALLEAMQENQVTIGRQSYPLPQPFYVFATQNPIEMEGTYPLPEAQQDRFLSKIFIDYPNEQEMEEILQRTTGGKEPHPTKVIDGGTLLEMSKLVREVAVAQEVYDYAINLVEVTRPGNSKAREMVHKYIRYGASPRGAQALILLGKTRALIEGRFNISREDIESVAFLALRHRLILNFEAQAEGISSEEIIRDLLNKFPA